MGRMRSPAARRPYLHASRTGLLCAQPSADQARPEWPQFLARAMIANGSVQAYQTRWAKWGRHADKPNETSFGGVSDHRPHHRRSAWQPVGPTPPTAHLNSSRRSRIVLIFMARLAQSAERKAHNLVVVGSGPALGVSIWAIVLGWRSASSNEGNPKLCGPGRSDPGARAVARLYSNARPAVATSDVLHRSFLVRISQPAVYASITGATAIYCSVAV